ncbi:MAG TPA: hypothetical protein VN767_11535 [Streptosporangiaceae bacterium]|jgi:hypothetical protein|nr:hypothetical protein [Streptosporangiaceae bacterium]
MRFVKAVIAAACVSTAWLAAMVLAGPTPTTSAAPAAPARLAVAKVSAEHLTARVSPDPSAPGTRTTFDVYCGPHAFSATLFGVTLGMANLILMHSTPGGMSGEFSLTVTLPNSIAPGTYHPSVDCSNGAAGVFEFSVNPVPQQPPETGDGATATQTGSPLVPIGYGLMMIGVLAGGVALRRRVMARH